MAGPLSPDRLLSALRAEGLTVVEYKSWRVHRRPASTGAFGPINGVMIHHTVTTGTASSVELCYNGHSALPGPLCHGVIDKAGTVHLVSAGRANHAGRGDDDVLRQVQAESYDRGKTITPNEANTDGNARFYGFECVNLGDGRDPWPAAQRDGIVRASAAICRAYGWGARSVIGHREWQPGKIDPRTGQGGVDVAPPVLRRLIDERLAHPASWSPGSVPTTPSKPTPTTPPKEEDDVALTPAQDARLARIEKQLGELAKDSVVAPWTYKNAALVAEAKKTGTPPPPDMHGRIEEIQATLTQLTAAVAALTKES
ncbi:MULTISPECIES: N-acetylmuramoyl-L-alanine amidase [Streptomyces]|uniref:N-acetylmuramoyl-L-alanine amidase n=1 Tax=Streptomyces TaxID=1883 RepID=UPI00206091FE|nr:MULTISPECIES: N-acetylmuramoyl-L-alanine amidase [Streptomyces]UPT41763.1 N-acetylmuramoyl-L-alanine amidase [Streptomyces sp. WAC00303]WIY75995.1 N-acetylmuramoyl-L-alanine amidase [Streptomyces anulatus]